jgi:hypothetical protein
MVVVLRSTIADHQLTPNIFFSHPPSIFTCFALCFEGFSLSFAFFVDLGEYPCTNSNSFRPTLVPQLAVPDQRQYQNGLFFPSILNLEDEDDGNSNAEVEEDAEAQAPSSGRRRRPQRHHPARGDHSAQTQSHFVGYVMYSKHSPITTDPQSSPELERIDSSCCRSPCFLFCHGQLSEKL